MGRPILAATDLTHRYRGLVKGPSRNRLKRQYRNIKKATQMSSIFALVAQTIREYGAEMAKEKLQQNGYKYALYFMYLLPGPLLTVGGQTIYTLSQYSRLRSVGVTVYNLGGAIINGELKLMDVTWLIPDFVLFGEYVSTFDYKHPPLGVSPEVIGRVMED